MSKDYSLTLQNCGEDDVISFSPAIFFKVNKLCQEAIKLFNQHRLGEMLTRSFGQQSININVPRSDEVTLHESWLDDGVDCEMLKIGANGWQKGKVKIKLQISVEFCPDEPEIAQPESSLDDIRRRINEFNS
ncbi:MAG: KGK domain-containing protein [Nostochopsis sp.]